MASERFETEATLVNGLPVIKILGEIDVDTSDNAADSLLTWVDQDSDTVVIDLVGLDFMDSTGIRLLIEAKLNAESKNRRLVLRLKEGIVKRALDVTGILGEFQIIEELADLERLKPASAPSSGAPEPPKA